MWLLVQTSTIRNVDSQNVDKPKRRQTETSTNQNFELTEYQTAICFYMSHGSGSTT